VCLQVLPWMVGMEFVMERAKRCRLPLSNARVELLHLIRKLKVRSLIFIIAYMDKW